MSLFIGDIILFVKTENKKDPNDSRKKKKKNRISNQIFAGYKIKHQLHSYTPARTNSQENQGKKIPFTEASEKDEIGKNKLDQGVEKLVH